MSIEIFLISGLIVVIVLAVMLLGLWTYRDARARGLNAGLWTAIVILVPDLIGLLLYFLIGRKNMVKCSNCNGAVQSGNHFCPHCGERMLPVNTYVPENRGGRGLLIGFAACIVVAIGLTVGMFAVGFMNDSSIFSSELAFGMVQNDYGNKWNVSFARFSGETKSSFNIKNGSPEKIYVKSEVESGTLTLDITQGDKVVSIDLDNAMEQREQSLEGFKDGKVTLRINGKSAKGGKINIWWE